MSGGRSFSIRHAVITVLGTGYAPFASGSWGSLASCVIFAAIAWPMLMAGMPQWTLDAVAIFGVLAAAHFSVHWGDWAIAEFGRDDPKQFVLDEFAGQWIALMILPPVALIGFWGFATVFASQFFLFRVFDVLKVPPAAQAERLPAGWGVLLDDLVAGAYANLVGQALWRLTPLAAWLGLAG
ncbi:MAG: phosphatidylglycerophosphatase A [Phycisphaerales bacterium]|nr:phosphatidylglycerophosphatase A [Phycisphaerales bacterium]